MDDIIIIIIIMGSLVSKMIERRTRLSRENTCLVHLEQSSGCDFPGCEFQAADLKNWMDSLDPNVLPINQIVWPGTHDSATDQIGFPFLSRPFAQCQTLSVYDQLINGTRVLDIRVQHQARVCHGILRSYSVDVVIRHVRRFLTETPSEIIILDIRTEYGHKDPPHFDNYLVQELGDYLIPHDDLVFGKRLVELLPKRIICVWKPRESDGPKRGDPLWSAGYLRDNWIDTDLPWTKFESNLSYLDEQPVATRRNYFYRVENTVTPQADNLILCVWPVTSRIHGYARLFINQCFFRGIQDRLQILSTDFIDFDFVHACVALTRARIMQTNINQNC